MANVTFRKTKRATGSMWGGNGFGTTYGYAHWGIFKGDRYLGEITADDTGYRERPTWIAKLFESHTATGRNFTIIAMEHTLAAAKAKVLTRLSEEESA